MVWAYACCCVCKKSRVVQTVTDLNYNAHLAFAPERHKEKLGNEKHGSQKLTSQKSMPSLPFWKVFVLFLRSLNLWCLSLQVFSSGPQPFSGFLLQQA